MNDPTSRFTLIFVLGSVCSSLGCGGGTPPTMEGRQGMLSRTAIAQQCEKAAKDHDRPFVIEWDATDLASFESRAKQATVFVKYTGCDLRVLYECKDPNNAMAYGTYGIPQPTSGTKQGFDISNEGELYANLPLGAAKLGGRVSAGENLHLEYFVSGVATSSRDAIYKGELQPLAGCAEATHYVWAYNLGAFELETKQQSSAQVEAGISGFGAGGERKSSEASLGRGGDIASCQTNDQRACKVPIRLALRTITPGDYQVTSNPTRPPSAMPPPGDAQATINATVEQAKATQSALAVYQEANGKFYEAHDGKACLAGLDRALTYDPRIIDSTGGGFARLRALCTMAAGKCDDGVSDFRAFLKGQDIKRTRTDADIEKEVRRNANQHCPASTAKNDTDLIVRISRDTLVHSKAADGKACRADFGEIEKRILKVDEETRKLDRRDEAQGVAAEVGFQAINGGKSALDEAAKCVAKAEGCKAGLELYKRSYRIKLPGMKNTDSTAEGAWKTMIDQKHIECK